MPKGKYLSASGAGTPDVPFESLAGYEEATIRGVPGKWSQQCFAAIFPC
jgi:hypothetical protein